LRYSANKFTLKFESLKDIIKVYNIIHNRKEGEYNMGKDLFEQDFKHIFKEAVHESYELGNNLRNISIKDSWEAIRLKMEEQNTAKKASLHA
jgi:hypothetical protein